MHRSRVLFGAALFAALLAAGSVGFAGGRLVYTSRGVIRACVRNTYPHTLRAILPGYECHQGETLLTWNVQGNAGPRGPVGPAGQNGSTLLSGGDPPSDSNGQPGDFYLDTASDTLYGPMTTNGWPSVGTSLVGPTGVAGAPGPAGPQGAPGAVPFPFTPLEQTFSSSGSYTYSVPGNVTEVEVLVIGAGGGGGEGVLSGGGGGGGGAAVAALLPVSSCSGAGLSVQVGAGGLPSNSIGNGHSGGASSVMCGGDSVVANGGAGGEASGPGGAGGAGSVSGSVQVLINAAGAFGSPGESGAGSTGGNNGLGSGGGTSNGQFGNPGTDGGGGGGSSDVPAGQGGDGQVLIIPVMP